MLSPGCSIKTHPHGSHRGLLLWIPALCMFKKLTKLFIMVGGWVEVVGDSLGFVGLSPRSPSSSHCVG